MEIKLESCRMESTRRGEEANAKMPWESLITITVRSDKVPKDLSSSVSERIGSAAVKQFEIEVGESRDGDLDL